MSQKVRRWSRLTTAFWKSPLVYQIGKLPGPAGALVYLDLGSKRSPRSHSGTPKGGS